MVLVAEAANDLKIPVEPSDHEQLLHDLRRLGKRVERSRLEPARHQEIPRSFGRRLRQHRGLDFEKVEVGQCLAHGSGQAVSQTKRPLEGRAAQILNPVAEAGPLFGLGLFFDRKREWRRAIEQSKLADLDLDLAGGQLRIDRLGGASLDDSPDQDYVLRSQLSSPLMTLR